MKKECIICDISNIIGKRWTLLILLELYKGNSEWKRFSELKNRLGNITQKILSSRLKELKKEDFIEKKIDKSKVPIKCEYRLTKSGRDFIKIIKNIKKWTFKWRKYRQSCIINDCKNCEN